MTAADAPERDPHPGMGFPEFVALIAAAMAINALSIDIMLPALPAIGESLRIVDPNDRQWVVTAYVLGFGAAQLAYGPLADRFGRKPILLAGLAAYTVFTAAAALADTFETMIAARVLQGVGAAATRVLAVSIVRDCYAGRTMPRVMSLAFIVFLLAPILAPALGQLVILLAPWRWIFGVLFGVGAAVTLWTALRLPETLRPERRTPLSVRSVLGAFRFALTQRMAAGYMLASTLITGVLFSYITSSQQVFADVLDAENLFTLAFALVAGVMGAASLLNSRIVERVGTRRVSHTALLGFIAFAALHAAVALSGRETLLSFIVLQSGMMFCFGLVGANFGAMAMEPLGRIAGTASSIQGFTTATGGALIGAFVGSRFNGTVAPLTLGFTACGVGALLIVLVTERGRLFQPLSPPAARPV